MFRFASVLSSTEFQHCKVLSKPLRWFVSTLSSVEQTSESINTHKQFFNESELNCVMFK